MILKCANLSIINKIGNRFIHDYDYGMQLLPQDKNPISFALANDKRDAFWKKYYHCDIDKESIFKRLVHNNYLSFWKSYRDFLFVSKQIRSYLREDLKNAKVIFIEKHMTTAMSIKQIERALSKARDIDDFNKSIDEELTQSQKTSIWFELERKLSSEITLS